MGWAWVGGALGFVTAAMTMLFMAAVARVPVEFLGRSARPWPAPEMHASSGPRWRRSRLTTAVFGTLMCPQPVIALLIGLVILAHIPGSRRDGSDRARRSGRQPR